MDRVIHRDPASFLHCWDKRQKPSKKAKMDLWPRSCLWKLQPVPNTSVWDDKMMWLLAATAQCQQRVLWWPLLLVCAVHGTPRLLLALQAEPLPNPDSTMTCFKWTHLKQKQKPWLLLNFNFLVELYWEAVTHHVLSGDFVYEQPSADWECTTGNPPPAPSLNLSRAGVTWPERFKAASHQ